MTVHSFLLWLHIWIHKLFSLKSKCSFFMVTLLNFSFLRTMYSWLSLSRTRLTRISGWVEFLSKFRTSLCINIYNLTPVESNLDESKFRLSWIKVLILRCRKPYYLHSLSQIYLSKHVYYLGIKIGETGETSGHWLWHFYLRLFHMFISQSVKLIFALAWYYDIG